MSVKKQYLKTKKCCKITFRVTNENANSVKKITLVGDFNQWNKTANPMKKMKNGDFSVTLELPLNQEFQYRYLYDDSHWENDSEAEYYVATEFPGTENSAVRTFPEK